MTDTSLVFNPFDPAFRVDPYPTYRRLREEAPFYVSPLGGHVLSRYAECDAILRDPRASSDGRKSAMFQEAVARGDIDLENPRFQGDPPFLFLDPPDHTRLRGLVQKAFTPRHVDALRPRVQELVDILLDSVADRGQMEVVEEFAYPLPVTVISEMLGVPAEDSETFKGWSRELARALDPDVFLPADVLAARERAIAEFQEYFSGLIAERRAQPREDLLSALIAAEEAGDKLTEEELLTTCVLLLVAGHETTVNLITNGILAFLRHPDELERLRDDPSLARTAVEEILRFDPPVQMTARVALEDIDLGELTIAKGEQPILLIASANRDPSQFAEPDRFDIGRAENRHLAFGFGPHFCLGAPLARLEGQIALTTLARRFHDVEQASDALTYRENVVLRGLAALPISFRAKEAR